MRTRPCATISSHCLRENRPFRHLFTRIPSALPTPSTGDWSGRSSGARGAGAGAGVRALCLAATLIPLVRPGRHSDVKSWDAGARDTRLEHLGSASPARKYCEWSLIRKLRTCTPWLSPLFRIGRPACCPIATSPCISPFNYTRSSVQIDGVTTGRLPCTDRCVCSQEMAGHQNHLPGMFWLECTARHTLHYGQLSCASRCSSIA